MSLGLFLFFTFSISFLVLSRFIEIESTGTGAAPTRKPSQSYSESEMKARHTQNLLKQNIKDSFPLIENSHGQIEILSNIENNNQLEVLFEYKPSPLNQLSKIFNPQGRTVVVVGIHSDEFGRIKNTFKYESYGFSWTIICTGREWVYAYASIGPKPGQRAVYFEDAKQIIRKLVVYPAA